jgi:D-amino peptidase
MASNFFSRVARRLAPALSVVVALVASAGAAAQKKVLMITDMEGVDGIFDSDLQCIPFKSPRWAESQKLLTGEINAAVDGLLDGGATDVVVWDGHWEGRNLSVLDIHPKARLLTGNLMSYIPPNPSYSAQIFIGQHPMAGAKNGVLSHTESDSIQNVWVNNKPTGEIGINMLLASAFGIPTIMLSGDTAACEEIHDLVPEAECAEVKSGVSRNAALMLSHPAACALIREKARRAMQRLPEFKPYRVAGPVEIKVEFAPLGTHGFWPRDDVEQLNERTWAFRGKDFMEALQKWWGAH